MGSCVTGCSLADEVEMQDCYHKPPNLTPPTGLITTLTLNLYQNQVGPGLALELVTRGAWQDNAWCCEQTVQCRARVTNSKGSSGPISFVYNFLYEVY